MRRVWCIARALASPRPLNPTYLAARQWQRRSSSAPPTAPDLNPQTFALRDYQEECIQAVLDHHDQGHRRLGISLATGSGKTVIFTQLIDRVKPLRENATQTLILVHRRELVEQAAAHCRNLYPDKTVELEMGTTHASGNADITVASIQSINSGSRISKFDPNTFKLILIDEAHHAVAKSYRKTLDHFGAMKKDAEVYLVGVSATFNRSDGLKLGAVIDHIVFHKDFVSMIDSGWLSKVLFTTVKSNLKLSDVRLTGANGDFNLGELSNAVNTPENNDVTVRSWMEKAGNRKSTLVFCVDIAHVVDMTNTFRRYGYEAFFVTGETPIKERTQLLEEFKAGKFPVLVNCGVYTEGTDIPNIDCVLLSRPTRSKTLLVQMIGRGMRLHKSKEDCHIIDVVGSVDKGVVTTPTLFGLDPEEVLDHTPSEIVKNKFELKLQEAEKSADNSISPPIRKPSINPEVYNRPWNVTFVDYDSIHDLLGDTTAERSVRQYSNNAWVWVQPGKYVLNTADIGYLSIIAKPKGGFYATDTRAMPPEFKKKLKFSAPYLRPRTFLEHANTLEDVLHGADTYAAKYPNMLLRYDVPWRRREPSEGQLEFLAKLTKKTVDEYRQEGLTKGQAADMLTRLKHGAAGLLKSIQTMKRKETRKELKALKESTPLIELVKLGKQKT
ncbi:hypothetical protein H072_3654 [Dactylellina haptotyla CBS 200.50]|uniref:Helicase ATP-binding domain-containing protein n=1 Tax=Dactylellina haptotyla (strain CBS 200.50) TaxID=1284197 RepID=S8C3X9_DACHA|nr:hypothetical protein H072_3654 [Dactylellina haptotyla CBS 200.50]